MSKIDHKKILKQRTDATQKKLSRIANQKSKKIGSENKAYALVGIEVGRTGQQVRNIVNGKIENPNGYLMESMIDAFNEL